MKYLLAVDLESTGLIPNYHEIMQIAIILLDLELNVIAEYNSLVQIQYPERGYATIIDEQNVFQFAGINPKHLKFAPTMEEVLTQILDLIRNKTKLKNEELRHVTLFGQNTKFDMCFLEAAFAKCGIKFYFDYHNVDLVSAFTVYSLVKKNTLPERLGLHHICKKLNIINVKEHNAVSDITTTVSLFKNIIQQLKEEK